MRKDFASKFSRGLGHRYSVPSMRLGRQDLQGLSLEEMENLPTRIRPSDGIKAGRKYHDSGKINWSFIRRWLLTQVGRQWNDVYADLSRAAKSNTTGDPHRIKERALGEVTVSWYWEDGKRMFQSYGRTYEVYDLFVDENGTLRYAPSSVRQNRKELKERKEAERFKVARRIGDRWFRKINGAWFELFMDSVKSPKQEVSVNYWGKNLVTDVFLHQSFIIPEKGAYRYAWFGELKEAYGEEVYAYRKQALSHSEAKALGLLDEV